MLHLAPQVLIVLLFCLMFALTLHEFAHAAMAFLCGDATAKRQGRMSLNPLAHLDLFGSLMLIFVGFGYAKPVPVNPLNFRYKNSDFYVAAAGPGMNLVLAIAAAILWKLLAVFGILGMTAFPLPDLLYMFMFINLNLCFFNLIPLGPLDGSYVLPHFLPFQTKRRFQIWNMQYGTQMILGLMILSYVLNQLNLSSLSPFRWLSKLSQWIIQATVF
ncbi:site-2 protease family protein [Deltaproteobacteria bacterium TL4]